MEKNLRKCTQTHIKMNYFVVHLRLGFPGNSADKESASKKEKRIYKNLPAMQETLFQFLGPKNPLEKG